MTVSIGNGVDIGNLVTAEVNPVTGGIRKATAGDSSLPIVFNSASFVPYRLATFGDSRCNGGVHTSTTAGGSVSGEKVGGALCQLRGDMQLVFNGGISGGLATDWNSAGRVSSSQTVKDLLTTSPDLVYIQFGINDYISGTSSATVVAALKALIDKIIGAGVAVVFESCEPAAQSATSYINGYTSTGGFGASATAKLAEMQAGNAAMKDWLAWFPSNVAVYVDSSSVTTGSDGFALSDQSYNDGTHISRRTVFKVAGLVDSAISEFFPKKNGQRIKSAYPNGINRSFLNPTSGRAANFLGLQLESGSGSATYQIVTDAEGDLCQEYNVTIASGAGTAFRARFDMLPDWVGASPFFPIVAGDILQGAIDYYVDDGAGGAPCASLVYGRTRIYYNDASNEFTDHGLITGHLSTDAPQIAGPERGAILTPRLAQKAAMGSANMLTTTVLQLYVNGNRPGTFRLRIKNPQWCKVA